MTLLGPAEFEEQINNAEIQLLDVRTFEEYTAGHIKNALQADWLSRQQFIERVHHLDKAKPLYIYCGTGVRSSGAAKWLYQEGFKAVVELRSGFIEWKKNNKPMESDIVIEQMNMNEYQSLLDSSSFILVDFGATWCPPCKKMEPVLEELKQDPSQSYVLIKIDAGVHTNVMKQVQVNKLPTFIVYKNGKETWRKEGLVSIEELKSHLQ